MAIAHSTTTSNASAGADSITISSFVVSGANPVLVVKAALNSKTVTITGATWNAGAEAFTQVNNDRNNDSHSGLWYLEAPTATTEDVVVSFSGSVRSVAAVSLYTGVDQTNPFRTAAAASNNGTSASPTVDVVANADEIVVDSLAQKSAGPDSAAGDHTERHDDLATGGGDDCRGASQEKASTGATETMGWSMGGSDSWAVCAAPLQPVGATTPQAMSATAPAVATLSTITTFVRTLPATAPIVGTLSTVATFARTLSSTAPAVGTLSRASSFFRTLSSTANAVGILVTSKTIIQTLSSTASAVGTHTAVQLKIITMNVTAAAVGTMTRALTFARTLSSAATAVGTLSTVKTILQTLSAAATAVGTMTRRIGQLVKGAKSILNVTTSSIMGKIKDKIYIPF